MSIEENLQIHCKDLDDTLDLAKKIGSALHGGEVIEFISDVGGGKTTFVRGLVSGAGSDDQVSSPTFTISKQYTCENFIINHYDFYRLDDPGIMRDELQESLSDLSVKLIEWSNVIEEVLPTKRLQIHLKVLAENERLIKIVNLGGHAHLVEAV